MAVLLNVLKWSLICGAVTALASVLKGPLDRRFSPRWRYWLWLVLASCLLLSPLRWERLLTALPKPAVTVTAPEVRLPVYRPAPASPETPTVQDTPAASAKPDAPTLPTAPATPTAPEPSKAPTPRREVPLSAVLAAVWLAGTAAFLIWHSVGTALLRRRIRRWRVPARPEVRELYGALCRELGVRRPPDLTVSRCLNSPMVAGLMRPRLCLPDRELEGRELEFILRHELTHVLRRDLWYKALMLLSNALHWFDPLIWLLRREANETVELLCDGQALGGADGATRREYCEALLKNTRRERGAALTTHFYGGARSVKNRFKNLLSGKNRRFGWAALAAGVLAVAVAACAVGVNSESAERGWTADLTLYDPDALLGEGFTVEATGLSSGSPEVSAKGGFGFLQEFTVTAEGLSFTAPVFTPREGEGWIGLLWNAVLTDPISGEDLTQVADPLSYYLRIWLDGVEREAELFEIVEAGDGYAYHVRFREPLTEEEAENGTLFVSCGSDEWLETHYPGWKPIRELWSVDLTDNRVYDAIFPGFGADVKWTDGEPAVGHLGDCSQVSDFTLNESCVSFTLSDNVAQEIRRAVLPVREYAVYDYLRDNTQDNRRENTPENRAALGRRFVVELDGATIPGELVVTGGNNNTYFAYVFEEPLSEPVNGTVHISVGTEDWNKVTELGASGDAPEDQSADAEWGFAVKITNLTAAAPAVEGEGAFWQVTDLRVTGQEVSFSLTPGTAPEADLTALRELAVYDPARDGSGELRRENTPELREALSRRFLVLANGDPVSGELIVGQGNGHQDYSFRFDTPLTDSELETAEIYAAVGDPLWVADHGLVYRWDNPYDFVDHCQVYPAPGAHIYYHWQTGVMHGGMQDLLVVWADGSRVEYLSQLPPLGEYEFSASYYAQDIAVSADGRSFIFTAPDYQVTGEGLDAALEDRGPARYRVDLTTGKMERLPDD